MNLFPQGAVAIIGVLLAYTSASAAVCSSVNSPTTIISTGCTDLVITDKNQASWTVEVSSGVNITQSTTAYSVLLGTVSGMSPGPTNLSAFTNNGSITSSKNDFTAFMLGTDATLGTLTNRGLIEGDAGIQKMGGAITTLVNTGTIRGKDFYGILNASGGSIGTITNTGTITGGGVGPSGFSIVNQSPSGSITTLNNAQGGDGLLSSKTALTFTGNLPANYNIIINSQSYYGQMSVTDGAGSTVFGISPLSAGSSVVSATSYAAVLTGVTATALGISGGSLLGATSNGYTYNLVETGEGTNIWDLTVLSYIAPPPTGPSAEDTLASFRPNAVALRNAFNLQSAKIAQGLSYDCSVFDIRSVCISFVGSRSKGENGLDNTAGALILAHRPNENFYFGAYSDQTFGSSNSGGLNVKRTSPGYGLFGVWSENADASGIQVRIAANYGATDLETTRTAVDTAEGGFGKSEIKSNGVQLEISRHYDLSSVWSARPYLGYRQTRNKRASYSESLSDEVKAPLTYSSLKQETETFLLGVGVTHFFSGQTFVTLAAGVEHDIKNDVDPYVATNEDIGEIDSINMEGGMKKNRPVFSLGFVHYVDRTQRIGFSITHRREAFESASTTSGMIQYSKGF